MGPYSWFLTKEITLFYWFYYFPNNVGNPLTILLVLLVSY